MRHPWEPGNRTVFQFKRIKPLGKHCESCLLALQLLFKPGAHVRKSFSQSPLLWWWGRRPYKVTQTIISTGCLPIRGLCILGFNQLWIKNTFKKNCVSTEHVQNLFSLFPKPYSMTAAHVAFTKPSRDDIRYMGRHAQVICKDYAIFIKDLNIFRFWYLCGALEPTPHRYRGGKAMWSRNFIFEEIQWRTHTHTYTSDF